MTLWTFEERQQSGFKRRRPQKHNMKQEKFYFGGIETEEGNERGKGTTIAQLKGSGKM